MPSAAIIGRGCLAHFDLPAAELIELVFVGRLRLKLVPNSSACFRMLPEQKRRLARRLWRVILRGLPDRLSHRQCERLILRDRGGRVVSTAAQR
jgi:hypothetical protein